MALDFFIVSVKWLIFLRAYRLKFFFRSLDGLDVG